MPRSFIETISQNSLDKFPHTAKDVLENPDLHYDWVKLWFEEAERLKQQMLDEGLPISAEAVQKIIDDQKRYAKCTTQA